MQKDTYPEISVVIPVKNEEKKIRDCIEGILSQTVPVKEIIVVDSGSTDRTLSILKEYDIVKIIEIPGSEFNHGATRNLGIQHATGDYVLMTVGDATAFDSIWIEQLLKGFENDSNVAGVCGSQVVPHDRDKNPIEWYRFYSEPEIVKYSFTKEEFMALSPEEKNRACSWDDVTVLYRRDVMQKIPFRFTSYAEDQQWAQDTLLAGYTLAYNPRARVFHYHLEDPDFSFKRNFIVMYYRYKCFGLVYPRAKRGTIGQLRLIKALTFARGLSLAERIRWWKYNQDLHKSLNKAIDTIHDALSKGEDYLDELQQKLSNKPPIPKKEA